MNDAGAYAGKPDQTAAITLISTRYFGAASFDSIVARAGVWPAGTQASQTEFIAGKSAISARKIWADRIRVLSLPH
jgi:hypothetical protein